MSSYELYRRLDGSYELMFVDSMGRQTPVPTIYEEKAPIENSDSIPSSGGLPCYSASSTPVERIEKCLEHEYYYGGNHKAAAAAIMRDIELGYIKLPSVV